jgi:hypothetical protein
MSPDYIVKFSELKFIIEPSKVICLYIGQPNLAYSSYILHVLMNAILIQYRRSQINCVKISDFLK